MLKNPPGKRGPAKGGSGGSAITGWKAGFLFMILMFVVFYGYVHFHPRFGSSFDETINKAEELYNKEMLEISKMAKSFADEHGMHTDRLNVTKPVNLNTVGASEKPAEKPAEKQTRPMIKPDVVRKPKVDRVPVRLQPTSKFVFPKMPVQGPIPGKEAASPLYGIKHKSQDAIFALACNYPKLYYERFVGTLRHAGYEDDIVLAVSPEPKMKPGVSGYIKETNIVAYAFDVDCEGKDNCKLQDNFLGYPDPRPFRTFANIRYALYEFWMRQGGYTEQSYILILDFRDTFFQAHPFANMGPFTSRVPKYDLQLYAENHSVKQIGICVFNSLWVGRCFGKAALVPLKKEAVICSGSTLGSYPAIHFYVRKMLASMDKVQCWRKGIESDQGYQNYLFYNGHFHTEHGNATLFQQGHGVVNTIGAMNGYRVPKEKKGPLDTFWKIRDEEGFIMNYDGTRSACVHQWDRWHSEVAPFLDRKLVKRKVGGALPMKVV